MTILTSHSLHSENSTLKRPYFNEILSAESISTPKTSPEEQPDIQWIPRWDSPEFRRTSVLTVSNANIDFFPSQIDAIKRLSKNFPSPKSGEHEQFDVNDIIGDVDETAEADIREFRNETLQPQHIWEVVGGLSSASLENSRLKICHYLVDRQIPKLIWTPIRLYNRKFRNSVEELIPNYLRFVPLDQQLSLMMSETSQESIKPSKTLEKRRISWKKENFFEKFGTLLKRNSSTKGVSENRSRMKTSSSTNVDEDSVTCQDDVIGTRQVKIVSKSREIRFALDSEESLIENNSNMRFTSPSEKPPLTNAYSPERSKSMSRYSRNSTEIQPPISPSPTVEKIKFVSKIPLEPLIIHRQSITSVDSGLTFSSSQHSTISRSFSSRPQTNRHLQNLNALNRLPPPLPSHITTDWGELESQSSVSSNQSFTQLSGPSTPTLSTLHIRRSVDQMPWDYHTLRRSFSNPENEVKPQYPATTRINDQQSQSVDARTVPKTVGNVVSYVKKWASMGKLKQGKDLDDWSSEFNLSLGFDNLIRRKSNGDVVPWAR
ncbi:hypothetical protein HK096_002865 [Nowakowskiella sp. JEL0078]|nr:hypothetical protein HK096_002865 [Nowakowskiella sp. JEL0078]